MLNRLDIHESIIKTGHALKVNTDYSKGKFYGCMNEILHRPKVGSRETVAIALCAYAPVEANDVHEAFKAEIEAETEAFRHETEARPRL